MSEDTNDPRNIPITAEKTNEIEFVGQRFDGTVYAEAIFNAGAPAWDILAVLFIDPDETDPALKGHHTLSGRVRYHLDDKHFDSDDVREWFRYVMREGVDGPEAIKRTVTSLQIFALKAAMKASEMGLVSRSDAFLSALASEVLVLPIRSKDPTDFMKAVKDLPSALARKATPEEIERIENERKMEEN